MHDYLSDRSLLYRTLRQAIAVTGLGLTLGLAICLTGCAQPDIKNASPADSASAAPAVSEAPAQQPPVPPAADRLTSLVVRAVPIGPMLQASLDKNPDWPVGAKASARMSASKLHCLRQRLSPEGYLESRAEAVNQFIQRYPDQVQDAIDVLDQGGADVMAATFKVEQANRNSTLGDIAKNFTPVQIGKYNDLTQNDQYQSLRQLLIGDSRPLAGKRAGADAGEMFGRQLMRNAMNYCYVPMSVLQ